MGQAHCHHDRAPEQHDDGDEDRRAQALEQDICQWLEERVGYEEDGQASIVLAARHVQGVDQAVEFGIADVGTVEEGDEVEQAEPGDQAEVEFPQEFAVLWFMSTWGSGAVGQNAIAQWPFALPRLDRRLDLVKARHCLLSQAGRASDRCASRHLKVSGCCRYPSSCCGRVWRFV